MFADEQLKALDVRLWAYAHLKSLILGVSSGIKIVRTLRMRGMKTGRRRLNPAMFSAVFLITVIFVLCSNPEVFAGCERCREPVVIHSVYADYDEIWKGLEIALNERGLTVSSVSHVGEMLERTGKELGRTRKIFEKANVMEFCSAVISRDMMERNPHFLAFCPYQIMVYTLPDDEKKVYLSYRRLIWRDDSGREVLEPVERLIEGLIKDVTEMYKKQ